MRRVVALAAAACALVAAQPAAADVPKRGELRVLVALVTWGPQPATPAEVQTELARVAPWFDETSFSQLRVIAETTPGWLTIPPVSGCASLDPTLHDTADAALRGAAFDLARYDVRAYLFPRVADCPFGGRASLVAGWMELNGAFRGELIVHELAHSLGLFHSRATPCTVWSGACQVDEYGDPYDVMGDGFGPFNGFHKLRLGWIRRTSVERDGTYSVDQLERPSSSAQVLTIETAAAHYVVDHREASLEPMPVTPDPSNGVLVYRWNGDQGPVLLSAGGSPRQYLLPIGRTYEVPDVFSVTPTARVGTSVDVRFAWTDRTPPGAPTPVEPRNGVRVRNGDEPILMWDDALETGSGLGGYEPLANGLQPEASSRRRRRRGVHAPAGASPRPVARDRRRWRERRGEPGVTGRLRAAQRAVALATRRKSHLRRGGAARGVCGSTSSRLSGAPLSRQSWQRSDAERRSGSDRSLPHARQMPRGNCSTAATMAPTSDGARSSRRKASPDGWADVLTSSSSLVSAVSSYPAVGRRFRST